MRDETETTQDRGATGHWSDFVRDLSGELVGENVLVTGGAGAIGSRLAAALAPVCDLTVLDDLTTGTADAVPEDATFVEGDVRDVRTVGTVTKDVDVIFHQAALVDVDRSMRAPLETHERNATGTVTVLEAARRVDASVVLASSAALYGRPDSLPVAEDDPKRPRSPYGVAKLAADQYTRLYGERYGLDATALRYFNVYGEGVDSGVIHAFVARAHRGEPLVVHGDGTQTRDFIHVDDVVRANLRAAVNETQGRAYNVGTGESESVKALARRVQQTTATESPVTRGSPRDGDIQHSRAAVERACEELGFEASVGLEEGLRRLASEHGLAEQTADD
jgi:UDP-glucose 4-epimerase